MESGKVLDQVPVDETVTTTTMKATNAAINETKIFCHVEQQPNEEKKKKKARNACGQIIQTTLRVLAAGSLGAACMIMFLSEQTSVIGGFKIRASYRVSPTFKFFVRGTGTTFAYSMVSVPMVLCLYRTRFVHVLDLLMMALAMASAASATAVGYIAKFGNDETGWTKSCNYYENYCLRSTVSIACSYFGFFCLLFVCIISTNSPSRIK